MWGSVGGGMGRCQVSVGEGCGGGEGKCGEKCEGCGKCG